MKLIERIQQMIEIIPDTETCELPDGTRKIRKGREVVTIKQETEE